MSSLLFIGELVGADRPKLPNYVHPFSLAGVARAALVYGNDHRPAHVKTRDVVKMCELYSRVSDPMLDEDPGSGRLGRFLIRLAYEQFHHQQFSMHDLARSIAVLEDCEVASKHGPFDWRERLGVSISDYVRSSQALLTASVAASTGQPTQELRRTYVDALLGDGYSASNVDQAIGTFSADTNALAQLGRDNEVAGYEKWSFNPLVTSPFVEIGKGFVAPVPRYVADKATTTGLYYVGASSWGGDFTTSLGYMFQEYVGRQLGVIKTANLHDEVAYGSNGELTVDFFLVTDCCVALVEVKSARPALETRLARGMELEDSDKKLGKAIDQINTSADLLASNHSATAHLNPDDLPLIGLVITLEPFHLANSPFYEYLRAATVPTAIWSSHELEDFVARASDAKDVGARLLRAVETDGTYPPSIAEGLHDLPDRRNPILDEIWQRIGLDEESLRARFLDLEDDE